MSSRNSIASLLREPFVIITLALTIAAFIIWISDSRQGSPKLEKKPLDYSQPVYTVRSAIICPMSLFADPRADHDLDAIYGLFMSFSIPDDKAKALGCEVVKEGIRVKAHRMDPPFHDFVAVTLDGQQVSSLFTMEAHLENDESSGSTSQVSQSVPQQEHPSNSQEELDNDEAVRLVVQKDLMNAPKLGQNLRQSILKGLPGETPTSLTSFLFTPYGACANILGDATKGYLAATFHNNPYMKNDPIADLGNFSDKESATAAAIQHCRDWYASEAKKPHTAFVMSHLYFSPEPDEQPAPIFRTVPTQAEEQDQSGTAQQ